MSPDSPVDHAQGAVARDDAIVGGARAFSRLAGAVAAVAGAAVLLVWLGLAGSGLPPMKANTAACLVVAGLALWCRRRGALVAPALRAAGLGVTAIGAATLAEYAAGVDLGLDQLLVVDRDAAAEYPGRMSSMTASVFVLIGLATAALGLRAAWTSQLLAVAGITLSGLAVSGYLFGAEPLYRVGSYGSIPLPAALLVPLLGAGVCAARPSEGLMAVVTADDLGGRLARRLLPAAVAVPITFAYVRAVGQRRGLYDTSFGTAVLATANAFAFTCLVWLTSRSLSALEGRRASAAAELALARTSQARAEERERAQEALRVSEARFRALFESAPDALLEVGADGTILLASGQATRLFGYPGEELAGRSIELLLPARFQTAHRRLDQAYVQGPAQWTMGAGREVFGLRRDGTEFPAEVSLSWTASPTGAGTIAAVRDVTAARAAARAVAAALAEKEVLLKEVHHRVKNNLQVVTSLLSLKANVVEGAARAALDEAQGRVRAMALVHEKLYRGDLARVDSADYLRELTTVLLDAYRIDRAVVRARVDVDETSLPVEPAVSLGLIVNELVSNALKHAFPGGRRGEVRVSLRAQGAGFALTVADDGVGLPPGVRPESAPSLGLQLVLALGGQLRGTLQVESTPGGGTTFRLVTGEARA